MKNKAVIIGASSEALHTIQIAKKYGLSITALDGNPDAQGLKVAEKALVVDISDEQATIEAVRREKPDFVLTVPIGRYLTTIGAVNDALGLPGISKEMAVLCTDKFAFHKKLEEKSLRSCRCYAIPETEDHRLSFPAILKPRYGSGSRGIYMLSNEKELTWALQLIKGEPYVLEECVPGEEYGVDGAVINGQFHLILLRKKENTPPPARQAVGYFSVQPTDSFYQKVRTYMKEVIDCLGLSECLLHADLIESENGPFVIELSARPSGHNLHNLFTPLCTGIDMAEEYIKYRIGQPCCFIPEKTKQMLIHYFDMEGPIKQVPTKEEIDRMLAEDGGNACGMSDENALSLVTFECHIKEGEVLQPVSDGHSVMGRGFFVLEGEGQETLKRCAEKIKNLFL